MKVASLTPPSLAIWESGWNTSEITNMDGWKITAPPTIHAATERLAAWAESVDDPVQALGRGRFDVPEVRYLGAQIASQIDHGTGVAWLRGVPPIPGPLLSLLYLAIGLELGNTIDVYGRLYEVVDHGESYRNKAIPVSQTRESTGMHTDSSNKAVWPRVVGLACLQPSLRGGGSRIVSSTRAHETLLARSPELLETLYGNFIRDMVTPGSSRDPAAVRQNAFPIFTAAWSVAMRYMRYWIEKGHERSGIALTSKQTRALDALDEVLESPAHTLRFKMKRGDMLFIDNTRVAHDRDAYVDDDRTPRRLLRLWIDRPRPDGY